MALQIKKKNLGSNQVDGSKILLAQGQAIRGFDQNGVEKDLIEFGESGEILVNGSEVTYKSVTDIIESDLSSEESARIAGDESLLEEIDLGMRVSNDRWAVSQAADIAIRSEFAAADSTEQSARIAGDAAVSTEVSTEKSRAEAAESVLTAAVFSEESARIAGDVSALAESKSYTDGKVSLVLSNLDSNALDSLVEVVGAFQQADQDLNNAISGLATQLDVRIDQVDIDVDSLEMRMLSAEGNISNEVSRATSEELLLKSRVTTAEQDVDSLEMRMLSAEGNISNEVSRASSEELLLKSRTTVTEQDVDSLEMRMLSAEGNISNEVSRATSEELLLKSRATTSEQDIDSLEMRMLSSEGNISNEISRATSEELLIRSAFAAADSALQSNIDDLEGYAQDIRSDVDDLDGYAQDIRSDLDQEVIDRESAVSAEVANRIAGDASALSEAKSYTDTKVASIPSVDLSSYETIANVDSKDAAKLVEAKAYADQVSLSAQQSSQNYADGLFGTLEQTVDAGLNASLLINGSRAMEGNLIMGDVSGAMYKITALADGTSAHEAATKGQLDAAAESAFQTSKAYADATFALQSDYVSIGQSLQATQEELSQVSQDSANALIAEQTRALAAEASLQSQITNVLSNVDGAALDSLTEIVTAFEVADSNLNGAITSLASSASSALSAEQTARIASDSALQGEIDAEEVARSAADTTLQNNISSEASARASAISYVQSQVDAEEVRAMGVEAQLQSDHDDLDGYAQDIRSDVDDLDGYAQDIRSDLDSEISRAEAAESSISSALSALSVSHDSRLDVLEAQTDGPSFNKMKIEISTNLVYVELAHEAIANSIVVSVGRLMAHKDEDFTVSVVGGVTHLTWIGSMVSPDGVEAIESGDKVFVTYAY